MAEHNYKITGTGRSTETADKNIQVNRTKLVDKLRKANVQVRLKTLSKEFLARYIPRQTGAGVKDLEISAKSWAGVQRQALRQKNLAGYKLNAYETNQFLRLTEEQLTAAHGTTSPAGRLYENRSSLDNLTAW